MIVLGLDTLLNLKYAYNGDEFDEDYFNGSHTKMLTYGLLVPSVGFQILQGPIVESNNDVAYVDGKEISRI